MEILQNAKFVGDIVVAVAALLVIFLAETLQQGRRPSHMEAAFVRSVKSIGLIVSMVFGARALWEIERAFGFLKLEEMRAQIEGFRAEFELLFWMGVLIGAAFVLWLFFGPLLRFAATLLRGVLAYPAAVLGWFFEPAPEPAEVAVEEESRRRVLTNLPKLPWYATPTSHRLLTGFSNLFGTGAGVFQGVSGASEGALTVTHRGFGAVANVARGGSKKLREGATQTLEQKARSLWREKKDTAILILVQLGLILGLAVYLLYRFVTTRLASYQGSATSGVDTILLIVAGVLGLYVLLWILRVVGSAVARPLAALAGVFGRGASRIQTELSKLEQAIEAQLNLQLRAKWQFVKQMQKRLETGQLAWVEPEDESEHVLPAYLVTGANGDEDLTLLLKLDGSWYRFNSPHSEESVSIELLNAQIEKEGREPGAVYRWKGETWELVDGMGPFRSKIEGSKSFLQGEELVNLHFLENQGEEQELILLLDVEYTGGRSWMQAGRLINWSKGREVSASFAELFEGQEPEILPGEYETFFQN
ncbi:hypothetical protein GTO10_01820 [Candidatus Saccharibacteria bacterium]|nr:hypothetical protein [Candidatus Saccharibacteria bacterium]